MAEIRVYHQNRFLCRAVCQELAGQTLGIKEIAQVRNERRQKLQRVVNERRSLVDVLVRPVLVPEPETKEEAPLAPRPSALKRYFND